MSATRQTGFRHHTAAAIAAAAFLSAVAAAAPAQDQPPRDSANPPPATQPATQPARPRPAGGGRGPAVVSPEVKPDRHVTFRILAPKAEAVRLNAGDIPGGGPGQSRNL